MAWLNPVKAHLFPTAASSAIPSTWCVAWGDVGQSAHLVWRDGAIALLSPTNAQSMAPSLSPSQRFALIGEVWLSDRAPLLHHLNHAPLPPYTDLDLIAAVWDQRGLATLTDVVGLFALVVWDRQDQVLWLGRDRVGARTLYYTTEPQDGTRWIAPNLRSLKPYHSDELDLIALRDYLCCAFVPGAQTLWQGVRELRPGTVLCWPGDQITTVGSGQAQVSHETASLDWHGRRLRSQLDQVVQQALPVNEPVGVFLSGGLDSSSITALATKFHTAPVHTYSIHFGSNCPNELEFSSLVASHCQTQHHILEISFRQMWERLPETMGWLDDPIGDPLTVPNLLLGQLARQQVGVVLNGEGGDPCFGGPKNQPMLINRLYGAAIQETPTPDPVMAYLLAFQKCAVDLPHLLRPEIWAAVQSAPSVFSPLLHLQTHDESNNDISYLNRLMLLNIQFKGSDQILTKVNNLSHAAGIQARSPLFDPRIVDLSLSIPPQYKLAGAQEKAVLKQAVADLLPPTIIHRPKSGMMVPVQMGFRRHWQRPARALLLDKQAAIAPYLNQTLIRDWLDYRHDTWGRYGVKLWLLVSLEIWLRARRGR